MARRFAATKSRQEKLICIVGSDGFHQEMIGRIPEAKNWRFEQVLPRTDVQPPRGTFDFDELYEKARACQFHVAFHRFRAGLFRGLQGDLECRAFAAHALDGRDQRDFVDHHSRCVDEDRLGLGLSPSINLAISSREGNIAGARNCEIVSKSSPRNQKIHNINHLIASPAGGLLRCAAYVNPFDLPLNFHPAAAGARLLLLCPRTFYRPWREFSGVDQGDRLVMPPDFVSVIGALLPIALCGRSSL